MTLDILICSLNKGIVRIDDLLLPQCKDVRYIVSYQYTDERYLELIPSSLASRVDVVISTHKGQGLSSNRNHALELAKADLVMFVDDDTHLTNDAIETIFNTFDEHPTIEVAFFRASTYTGKLLKNYPETERDIISLPNDYSISTIEMVCRRDRVQGKVRFDEKIWTWHTLSYLWRRRGMAHRRLTCRIIYSLLSI